ncbi:uncharacterized protein LOC143423787 [Xylocopa sonorina]|uniref:uncharacterized protein LOC143423787 n=1 Tax=Xylocopa sonorina TaxID=1818115 RepID=UPI00403A82DC
MSEQILLKSINNHDAINSNIVGILNPTMHHHDLLQSYVRAPTESASNSKQSQETNNSIKTPSSLGICLDEESVDEINKECRVNSVKKGKDNDKKQEKSKSDKSSIQSEISLQKKKK